MQVVLMQHIYDGGDTFAIEFYNSINTDAMLNSVKQHYGEYWNSGVWGSASKSLHFAVNNINTPINTNNQKANPLGLFIFATPTTNF